MPREPEFFAVVLLAASLRTNAVFVLTLALAVILVFFLGGHYGANTTLVHWGGYLGIAASACVFYMALADLCEICYGRVVFTRNPCRG